MQTVSQSSSSVLLDYLGFSRGSSSSSSSSSSFSQHLHGHGDDNGHSAASSWSSSSSFEADPTPSPAASGFFDQSESSSGFSFDQVPSDDLEEDPFAHGQSSAFDKGLSQILSLIQNKTKLLTLIKKQTHRRKRKGKFEFNRQRIDWCHRSHQSFGRRVRRKRDRKGPDCCRFRSCRFHLPREKQVERCAHHRLFVWPRITHSKGQTIILCIVASCIHADHKVHLAATSPRSCSQL